MNERLKMLRRFLDLTQQEFADRIGIARGNIGAYEVGKNAPSDAVIALVCREFNVNEEWLRDGVGEMFAPDVPNELDALALKYGLGDADRVLIDKYLSLKPKSRNTIIQFITDIASALGETDAQDLDNAAEAAEAEYIKSRSASAQSMTSSASNTTDGTENKAVNQ